MPIATNVVTAAVGADRAMLVRADGTLWMLAQERVGKAPDAEIRATLGLVDRDVTAVAIAAGFSRSTFFTSAAGTEISR